jgi:hypothetical protein
VVQPAGSGPGDGNFGRPTVGTSRARKGDSITGIVSERTDKDNGAPA